MSVTALQDDFQRFQVSRSIENGPIESELPNESTAPATESLSPLDLFIRDLDERKGKLPYCQEVTDIQTSVEKFVNAVLLGVEKKLPFYKTTLVNSGSFYEGTKVGKPDEFDYFVQLDNFSRPKDILYEELAHCMVIVIPSEAAVKRFRKFNPNCFHFEWKREVKSPFVEAFSCFLATGFKAFGLKILSHMLNRHGPAYTLELEWNGGEIYKGLKIKIDLSLAVKINSHSSTMAVDFESGAGKVVKSLLHTMPYYFAVSGYRMYRLSPSKLFKEHKPGAAEDFIIMKEKRGKFPPLVITCQPNDCCLRCSQSCLELSLFRDHFGPDGGPSVCLRVLKVLRDMTLPYAEDSYIRNLNRYKYNSVDKRESECIDKYVSKFFNDDEMPVSDSDIDLNEYVSTKWISSYTLKTLVLFEWSKNPEDKQWTGSNLTQRLVNILHNLLSALKKNKGIRSFWYKDYNALPKEGEAFLPGAINRVTIIRNCVSSLGNASNYCFENCVQTFTNILTMARQKRKLADFLHTALRKIFWDKVREVLEESVGKKKKERPSMAKGHEAILADISDIDFLWGPDTFSDIYLQALLDKIAPEEDLVLTYYYECTNSERIVASGIDCQCTKEEAEEILKNARDIFEENARKRMNDLDNLPDYSLWSQDFTPDEVTNMLKFLCENFEKDLEILRKKLKTEKESRKPGIGLQT